MIATTPLTRINSRRDAARIADRRLRRERFDVALEFDGHIDQIAEGGYLHGTVLVTVEVERVDDRDEAGFVSLRLDPVGLSVWLGGMMFAGQAAIDQLGDRLPALVDLLRTHLERRACDVALGY